jgi:hypothetical protein
LIKDYLCKLGLPHAFERTSVLLLLISGLIHAMVFLGMDRQWEDPLSFRKATLFGISTGVTLWSTLWVLHSLCATRPTHKLSFLLCSSVVLEVALITLQTWRGVESHFNRTTLIDACIEFAMLVLIIIAMACIAWITLRSWRGNFKSETTRAANSAARWGMFFILISGGIGFAITGLGSMQLAMGNSPRYWPSTPPSEPTSIEHPINAKGVLKFPHGATLHAIQVLAFIAWLARKAPAAVGLRAVQLWAASHAFFLIYSIYQTAVGHARFELDILASMSFAASIFCALIGSWVIYAKTTPEV